MKDLKRRTIETLVEKVSTWNPLSEDATKVFKIHRFKRNRPDQ